MDSAEIGDPRNARHVLWLIPLVIILGYAGIEAFAGRLCSYMGTDFRGYFASGQIIWERSFAEVYNQATQSEFQANLRYACPDSNVPQPAPLASVPYLPIFLLVFLPLPFFEFTISYLVWTAINLIILLAYLVHFLHAVNGKLPVSRFLQWVIILPVFANLYLGQSNIWLAICLGEFFLAHSRNRNAIGGLWLAGLALKPHTVLLLVPGLALGRQWRSLAGFSVGLLGLLGASIFLAGVEGVISATMLSARFAGPLIQTVPGMINLRALVSNLAPLLPDWFIWGGASVVAVATVLLVGYLWMDKKNLLDDRFAWLLLATLSGTLILTLHSHFYLLMALLPVGMFLDSRGLVSNPIRAFWSLGPLAVCVTLYIIAPEWIRTGVGMSFLAMCAILLIWSARKLQATYR